MERQTQNRTGQSRIEIRVKMKAAVVAGAGVFFLPQAMPGGGTETAFSNSFLAVLFFGLLLRPVCDALKEKEGWKDWLPAGLAGFGFAAAVCFGSRLEREQNADLTRWTLWAGIFFLGMLFTCLWQLLFRKLAAGGSKATAEPGAGAEKPEKEAGERLCPKRMLLTAAVLFACWFLVLLAVYPGFFVYDAQDEYLQVVTRQFTNQHPLFHVLLLGGIIQLGYKLLGSVNAGIVLYMLFQMTVMAVFFSYVIEKIRRFGVKRLWLRISVLFLGFFPVIPMYVLCSSKDTFYTASLLGAALSVMELVRDAERFRRRKRNWLFFGLCLFGMAAFRNNGFYVFLVWTPFLLLWAGLERGQKPDGTSGLMRRKGLLRKMAVTLGAALIAYLCMGQAFGLMLHPKDVGTKELFTVPIQQLARTYAYSPEQFSEAEKETLFEILPEDALKAYRGKLSDPVKIQFQAEAYDANPQKYQKLWLSMGLRNPSTYLNAWLLTSYGFWYPDAVIDVYRGNGVFTFTYEDSSYFGFETEEPGVRESKLPWLEELYRKLSLEVFQQKAPVVSMLFSPGFLFWVWLTGLLYVWKQKQTGFALALCPLFLNWLTVLLGPTYLVRYVLIFWFALPLLPVLAGGARAGSRLNCLSDVGNCVIL